MTVAVSRETERRLASLEKLVLAENGRQNLISSSTVISVRSRHIDDSLQLVEYVGPGPLLDIGSGAGFPGLVLACCRDDPVHLVEPRARRADFLAAVAISLELHHITVHRCQVQRVTLPPVATITARAVASLPALFDMALHVSNPATRWVLPKGRTVATELDAAQRTWQGRFRLIPSLTDPEAAVVIAEAVRRRPSR